MPLVSEPGQGKEAYTKLRSMRSFRAFFPSGGGPMALNTPCSGAIKVWCTGSAIQKPDFFVRGGILPAATGVFCTRSPALGGAFLWAKKPLKPKLKRFLLPTFLQVLEAISPQFVNVIDTYTNQQDVQRMLHKLPHAWPSHGGPASNTLSGFVCLRDYVSAPCEAAKLMNTSRVIRTDY